MHSIASPLRPLWACFADPGSTLIDLHEVDGGAMPQPYRRLLVHASAMTPTLEAFCGEPLHLRPLSVRREGAALCRDVTLVTRHGMMPMEFGAIRIALDRFSIAARAHILDGQLPLGTILRVHAVPHTSQPLGYFTVAPGPVIAAALSVPVHCRLYGRHNRLVDRSEQLLAQVVEILQLFEAPTEDGDAAGPRR